MKSMLHVLMIAVMLVGTCAGANSQNRSSRKEEQKKQFQKVVELVEKGTFIFEAQRAFPQGGASVDLTTNYGFIRVEGEMAEGYLPFFGRAYSVDFGGGGIKFKGTMQEAKTIKQPKKLKLLFTFQVKDKDTFDVSMDIGMSGNTTVNVRSNNRSTISYYGKITALEKVVP